MSMEVKKAYVKNSTWCNIFKSSPKCNWNPFSPLSPHSDVGKRVETIPSLFHFSLNSIDGNLWGRVKNKFDMVSDKVKK